MKVTQRFITLDNGSVWPNPNNEPSEMDSDQARLYLSSVHSAYHHLLTHPIGTEAVIKTLRELRRAAKVRP